MKFILLILAFLFLFTSARADVVVGTVSIATPPIVTINLPVSDVWYSSTIVVNVSINNGTAHAVTYRWSNSSANGSYVSMTRQSNSLWTRTFDTATLADGNYTLLVDASNRFNMTGNATVRFRSDNTAPVIVLFRLLRTKAIGVGDILGSGDFDCNATDNSESIGGSVSVIITGLSTSSAGTKTATCTATDSAGNVATAIVRYVVGESGGEGAGGTASAGGEISNKSTAILEQVPASRMIVLNNFPKPIDSLEMYVAVEIKDSDVVVGVSSSGLPVSGAAVFSYFDVTSNIPASSIDVIRMYFSVDKSWLEKSGLSAENVALYVLENGAWVRLQTEQVGESASAYNYKAILPDFSTFAIAASKQNVIQTQATAPSVLGAAVAVPLAAFSKSAGLIVLVIMIAVFAYITYAIYKRKRKKRHKR